MTLRNGDCCFSHFHGWENGLVERSSNSPKISSCVVELGAVPAVSPASTLAAAMSVHPDGNTARPACDGARQSGAPTKSSSEWSMWNFHSSSLILKALDVICCFSKKETWIMSCSGWWLCWNDSLTLWASLASCQPARLPRCVPCRIHGSGKIASYCGFPKRPSI